MQVGSEERWSGEAEALDQVQEGGEGQGQVRIESICVMQICNFGASTHDLFDVPRRLAVKSNGAEKPKTRDLSNVTRGLAVMSIAEEQPDDEELALLTYQ